ncbi:MAG: hypothetical protein JWN37_59 [Candidatus Nomurabacteria bacterium]|nr:hypothetical protein [Candidatus Nomurabacteria bacterium]
MMDTESQKINLQKEDSTVQNKKDINLYPALRRGFLIFCIIAAIFIILFLIYQNGKSIYANGI